MLLGREVNEMSRKQSFRVGNSTSTVVDNIAYAVSMLNEAQAQSFWNEKII